MVVFLLQLCSGTAFSWLINKAGVVNLRYLKLWRTAGLYDVVKKKHIIPVIFILLIGNLPPWNRLGAANLDPERIQAERKFATDQNNAIPRNII